MIEEVENAAGEQYMRIQRKAPCIQTIEQACLMDSIASEHTVACILQTARLAFIRLVPNISKIVTNSKISSLSVLLVVRQRLV